jgi:hypothetical protein
MENAGTINLIRFTVEAIEKLVEISTGLGPLERKVVAYYALATHTVPKANTFPLLVFIGPMGTGKSETSRVIKTFAYNPRALTLRGMSPPALRDELVSRDELVDNLGSKA